ncbi:hypothetical protein FBU59_005085 [Linderina macrospora]|uniref:Uncharacterized protein n=1 Tax=Linderina macrospora TaxID=4868 RepID=A0ACC1J3W5_9FUNG|nr:hypothetical protein FBU59_005085 [Linderina macrospora]
MLPIPRPVVSFKIDMPPPVADTTSTEPQRKTKSKQSKPKPTQVNDDVLDDMSRFEQEFYLCPFCGYPTTDYKGQIRHIGESHPWYSLEIHANMR